jgi:hypothetical protein
MPAFGARTFSIVITTSAVHVSEKIDGVDSMMRWLSIIDAIAEPLNDRLNVVLIFNTYPHPFPTTLPISVLMNGKSLMHNSHGPYLNLTPMFNFIKGRDFRPPVFFIKQLYLVLGPLAKAFLHMASYSRRYLTMKSIFFVVRGVNDTADQSGRSVTFWLDQDPHSEKASSGSNLNLTLSHSGTADQW